MGATSTDTLPATPVGVPYGAVGLPYGVGSLLSSPMYLPSGLRSLLTGPIYLAYGSNSLLRPTRSPVCAPPAILSAPPEQPGVQASDKRTVSAAPPAHGLAISAFLSHTLRFQSSHDQKTGFEHSACQNPLFWQDSAVSGVLALSPVTGWLACVSTCPLISACLVSSMARSREFPFNCGESGLPQLQHEPRIPQRIEIAT